MFPPAVILLNSGKAFELIEQTCLPTVNRAFMKRKTIVFRLLTVKELKTAGQWNEYFH